MKTIVFLFAFCLYQRGCASYSKHQQVELKRVHRAGIRLSECAELCRRSTQPQCMGFKVENRACVLQTFTQKMEFKIQASCRKLKQGVCPWGFTSPYVDNGKPVTPMSCYRLETEPMTWYEAREDCKLFNGDLVTINNDEENEHLKEIKIQPEFVKYTSLRIGFWIGGTDIEIEGDWRWAPSGGTMIYEDWYPSEPNDKSRAGKEEDCASLWENYQWHWNDANCESLHMGFICEKEGGFLY